MKRWILAVLLFSVTVNVAVLGTLLYEWRARSPRFVFEEKTSERVLPDDMIWLQANSSSDDSTSQKLHDLHLDYTRDLRAVRDKIEGERGKIIAYLLSEPVKTDSIEQTIHVLVDRQVQAEKMTIDHLLDIKPLIPKEAWRDFVIELTPKNIRHKKIIHIQRDSTGNMHEDIEEIRIFQLDENDNKTVQIEIKKNEENRHE